MELCNNYIRIVSPDTKVISTIYDIIVKSKPDNLFNRLDPLNEVDRYCVSFTYELENPQVISMYVFTPHAPNQENLKNMTSKWNVMITNEYECESNEIYGMLQWDIGITIVEKDYEFMEGCYHLNSEYFWESRIFNDIESKIEKKLVSFENLRDFIGNEYPYVSEEDALSIFNHYYDTLLDEMKKPIKVMVEVDGGLVMGITSNVSVQTFLIDHDNLNEETNLETIELTLIPDNSTIMGDDQMDEYIKKVIHGIKLNGYYQPVLSPKEWEEGNFPSFGVFKSLDKLLEVFPDHEYEFYSKDDIENPTFMDDKF
jgi:hypothetical protein